MDKISNLKKEIIDTLDFNKATDIVSIDLEGKSSMADYMIIASGTSSRHIQALSEQVFEKFKKTPQLLKNIEVKNKNIINKPEIKKSIRLASKLIKGSGRILVRKSGTESKIRIMGESENKRLLVKCVNIILKKIR